LLKCSATVSVTHLWQPRSANSAGG